MLRASREEALLKLLTEFEDNIAHSWPDHKYKPWKAVTDAESDNDDFGDRAVTVMTILIVAAKTRM